MKPILALFALLSSAPVYNIEPANTQVEYMVDSTLHTVHGTFVLKKGTITVDPASGSAQGELVVDANSGSSGSDARDHRMTREILETAKYPDISFQPDRMEGALATEGDSHLTLHGVMAIHGAKHELIAQVDARPVAGGYDATAHFDVPYVDWGMKNPSNFLLKVNKVVKVTVHTVVHTAT